MRQPLPTAQVDDERSTSDPVEEAIRNADLAALWSAIAALPRQQRDALLLREFGGLSYAELAGALAVTDSAVESLLFRARNGVRARLESAYASLSGASWVESLARLFGGIGGAIAPVAAKVAVVSVGAAVATGGYVAAPHMLRAPSKPAPTGHTHASGAPPPVALVAEAHATFSATPAAPVSISRSVGGDSGEHGAGRSHGSDDDEAKTAASSGSDGAGTTESDHRGKRATTAERSSSDETDASPGRDGSGESAPSDGSGDGSGEDHGGVTTTATNPAVTVTVPVTDPAPTVGDPVPTTGG
jgi:hypothetical protein